MLGRRRRRQTNIKTTLVQRFVLCPLPDGRYLMHFCHFPADIRHRPNADEMLAHDVQRWHTIKSTLGTFLQVQQTQYGGPVLVQFRPSVVA